MISVVVVVVVVLHGTAFVFWHMAFLGNGQERGIIKEHDFFYNKSVSRERRDKVGSLEGGGEGERPTARCRQQRGLRKVRSVGVSGPSTITNKIPLPLVVARKYLGKASSFLVLMLILFLMYSGISLGKTRSSLRGGQLHHPRL